jgi:signal transduction histidine kinase
MATSEPPVASILPDAPVTSGSPDFDESSVTPIRSTRWLDKLSPMTACLGGGFLIGCIGVLSYVTDPQFSCSLLYLIPILLVTRVAGFRYGLYAALLATGLWLYSDLCASEPFFHRFIPYWNAGMRFGTFFVGISLVSAMRSLNAHLEERVNERTTALNAQFAEKRELEKSILEISDREQVRLGQDLHDGLCQQLVSAAFSTNILQQSLSADSTVATRNAGARLHDEPPVRRRMHGSM